MSDSAPRGGELHISSPREDHPTLSLCLKANSIILHQGSIEALKGPPHSKTSPHEPSPVT